MKQVLVAALTFVVALSFSGSASAQTASATYYAADGRIQITVGEDIGVVGFETAGLFTNISGGALLGTKAAGQFDANTLAWFDPAGLPSGTFTVNGVLPAGRPANHGIGFAYSPVGADSILGDVTYVPAQVIPEPASLGLFGLASVLGLVRRRR